MRRGSRAAWVGLALLAAWPALADPLRTRPEPLPPARSASLQPPSPAMRPDAVPMVVLRSGEHPGFTRLVFHLPPAAEARVEPRPDGVSVHVPGAVFSKAGPGIVPGLVLQGDTAVLSWGAGTQLRQMHLPGRLVIDLLHAGGVPAAAPAAVRPHAAIVPLTTPKAAAVAVSPPPMPAPVPAQMLPAPSAGPRPAAAAPAGTRDAALPPPPPAVPQATGPQAARPQAAGADAWPSAAAVAAAIAAGDAPAAAPTQPVNAAPLAATPSPPAPSPATPEAAAPPPLADPVPAGLTLPFSHGTGAAAFRRGPWAIAVFDEARPLDLAALHAAPGLSGAEAQTLAAATELRVRLGADQALSLGQRRDGWSVAVVSGLPSLRAIHPVIESGHLKLGLDRPGRVLSVPDPDTGGLLLVGTQAPAPSWALRAAAAAAALPGAAAAPPSAQGVPVERRSPLFALLATWQGVAVEPGADDLVLHAVDGGYVLERTAAGEALSLAAADGSARVDAAAAFSRLFDLPDTSVVQLKRRLAAAAGLASGLPPQDRGGARVRAAQAMLALGLGAEAAGLVRLAQTDDARLVADPQAQALAAAAALLAGRTADAAGLADPALTAPGAQGADEAMLWRALLAAERADAAQQDDPAAAQILAAKLPLLQAYPTPLRDRLIPLALRTMALGGETAAAQRAVDTQPDDRRLDYVRALLDERSGRVPEALGLMDRLVQTKDRDISSRAAVRAVEIRLASHALTAREAADALDPLIYAWRGDGRELAVRLREASLRLQAGQAREALAVLRDAADPVLSQGWPAQRPAIAARLHEAFAEAVSRDAGAPMSPLDFVAMVQENADLIPGGPAGQALAERVADRLASLDLPDQAAATLGKLVDQTPPGPARATLGDRLAALQVDQHDEHAALMTLSASTGEGLPPALVESRTMLFARATAAHGNLEAATGALEALATPQADNLEAKLLADAGHWPQATAVLRRVARATLPSSGMLNDAQSGLLLRLASAAAQAGDAPTLAAVRDEELPRVPAGRSADLLRVLTEGPVQTVADLPRAGAEMALARSALK